MSDKIQNLAALYLRREILLEDFQRQFAGLYFQVRRSRDRRESASKLCDWIVGPLAELSRGHRSEDSFREELANAVRPFASEPVMLRSPEAALRPSVRTQVKDAGFDALEAHTIIASWAVSRVPLYGIGPLQPPSHQAAGISNVSLVELPG
jgi:hypothetical protein